MRVDSLLDEPVANTDSDPLDPTSSEGIVISPTTGDGHDGKALGREDLMGAATNPEPANAARRQKGVRHLYYHKQLT